MIEEMNTRRGDVVLAARGVGRVFGEGSLAVRALYPTDIQIRAGEVLAIMGPSGSGKTTLLSILGCVLRPTEGEVLLGTQSLKGYDEEALTRVRRENIGFIFQQFNLISGLDALDNATVPLVLQGLPRAIREERGRDLLEKVGLKGKEGARPRQLSGGQQQRVAIARALSTNAPVMLCDEPTAALDGTTGRSVLGLLRDLARDLGRAVVIVTHDERVMPYIDRLVHVMDGRIVDEVHHPRPGEGTFVQRH